MGTEELLPQEVRSVQMSATPANAAIPRDSWSKDIGKERYCETKVDRRIIRFARSNVAALWMDQHIQTQKFLLCEHLRSSSLLRATILPLYAHVLIGSFCVSIINGRTMVTFWRHWIFATIVGVGAFVGMLVPPLVADENVGIGTTRPDSSAVLDVSIEALSRPRGMLIPRMTEQERDAIIFPARGLLIFNTTRNRIEMNIGDRTTPVWAHFVTYGESSGGDWALTGNAGIDPSRNFLGTVDAAPLIFKTDARERMRITPIGAVGIGTVTPLGLFAVGPNSEFYVDSSGTIYGVQLRLQGSNARLYIDGSSGIAGDILVSSGPNAPQRWTKQLDSLEITSLRSSTVSSRSVVTDTLRAQYIVGGIPFDSVKSGINQNQTLTVGNGSTVEASGTGIVRANRVNLTGTNAPLETNGNAGTSGQLLKSRGAGQTPEWTWSVDSLDIRRLTTKHVWADTVTADSVRGRVGRFDSLVVATPFAWQLKGNSGTNPATNFLGTTDAQPLVLRTNGSERLRVESGGNVGIGTPSPTHRLHVNAPSDPLRLEGVQTDASPAEVLTVTATGVVKKASVASIVGGGILKGIFTPTTTASQFTISPGQDIQPGAVVVVTVYGSSSSGVVGAMVTNINAATDTFTIATTMAIDNTYAIHYIIINP